MFNFVAVHVFFVWLVFLHLEATYFDGPEILQTSKLIAGFS